MPYNSNTDQNGFAMNDVKHVAEITASGAFFSSMTPQHRWLFSGLQRRVDWYKLTNTSEGINASIITANLLNALMTESVRTS
jgi:hypothetical protein